MNLETARKIIEQEALLLLIAKPYLQFNINNGVFLARIFVDEGFKLHLGRKMRISIATGIPIFQT